MSKTPTTREVLAFEAGYKEALLEIEEWSKKNEYCPRCCSPKKYCKMWGVSGSALETKDLLTFIKSKKENK